MDLDRTQTGARFVVGTRPGARHARSSIAGIVYAAIGLLYFGFLVISIVSRGGAPLRPGWSAKPVGGTYTVTSVEPGEPFNALKPGDRIVSVAGDPDAGSFGPALALSRVPFGSTYVVQVRRGGSLLTVSLPLNKSRELTWNEYLPTLIVAFLLYATAAYVAAVRWRDMTARLAATSFLLTVLAMMAVIMSAYPGWTRLTSTAAIVIAVLYRPWELPVLYHFCSRFPHPVRETAAGHIVRWAFYTGAAVLWIPINVPVLAHVLGLPPLPVFRALLAFRPDGQPGALIISAFESIAGVLACLVLVRNYRRLRDPDSRQKIRWAGLAVGVVMAAFLTFAMLKVAWYLTGSTLMYRLAVFVNNTSILVVGLSLIGLAYAVVRHHVLGIHVVLRSGLQYLLARNVLRLIVFLPLLILLAMAIAHPDRGLSELLLRSSWRSYAALVVTGAVSLRYRTQMRLWLDQKFFHVALEQEQMLATLIERIKAVESEEELCLVAGRELDAALHVNGCHIFLRSPDGRMRVAYSQRPDRAASLREWLNDGGLEQLNAGSLLPLYEVQTSGVAGDAEEPELMEHLVVPFMGTGLCGIGALVLGPKRSQQPYTSRDRDLLKAIAGQMTIMEEILHLKQRVAQERRVRVQVLGHLDHHRIQLLNECPDCGRCYTTAESACTEDGASLSLTLPVERTIDEKYRLDRRIGRGGMGVVYRAHDTRLDRPVAIKMMVGDLFGNTLAMARFEREARTVAGLKHPNIVAVHDFGRLPTGGAYLVMELIDGRSWREHLAHPTAMLEHAPHWMTQLCLAVEAAHEGGIIHRDLKPENIMIADEGNCCRAIVLDFGLAKVRAELSQADRELTMAGAIMGTRGYMSPEQRSGRAVDQPTDVYSVAVICAETLTRRRPPNSGASLQWLKSSLSRGSAPSTPGTATANIRLDRLLQQALAEHPGQRPSMREFREELSAAGLASISALPADSIDPHPIDPHPIDPQNANTMTMPPRNPGDR